jgi:TonB-linked outer membrane protein, SusC/RagA family
LEIWKFQIIFFFLTLRYSKLFMRNRFISRNSGRSFLLFSLCFFCFNSFLFSQHFIKGHVTGRDGVALPGATVAVKGTNNISTTDSAGNFMIMANPGNVIRVTFVGYHDYQHVLNDETELNVSLTGAIMNLDDVVVIGYGTAKKRDLTGAVGSVSAKDFNKGIFASPDQLIQGKVSGVQIMYNNGEPGGAAAIKIRGNSALTGTGQPLFVIDGVPLDGRSLQVGNNPLNFINPDDIASIDVLKDASATAIYGSRAAFGVVIINTKKGQAGPPKLTVTVSSGVSSILKKIKVLNASQYRDAIKYYNAPPSNDRHGDVDALDAILQHGVQQNYTIGVSGGNENGKYRISGNLLNQDGILKNSGFNKYGFDLSTNFKFLDNKKLGLDINVNSNQYIQSVPNGAVGASGLIQSALQWNPTDSLKKSDGSLNINLGGVPNPAALIKLIKYNLKVTTVLGSISPYYKFTDWLEYKLLVSINYSPGIFRYSTNQQLDPNARGFAAIENKELTTQQVTQTLNFNKEIFSGFNVNAVAGFEYMKFSNKGFALNAYGVPGIGFGNFGLDYTNYIQYSNTSGRSISSYAEPVSKLNSLFGRTIFNYKDKYLLTATFRADGSTKFGENNKYGYFPSLAAAWNISKEKFFKLPSINLLKIRGGWGKTGNQEFPSGAAQAKYSFQDNGNRIQVNNPNPDLKWQSDKQYNIGADFSIFNNRISGTVDYFNKTTTSLLFPGVPIQPAPPLSVVRWINLDGKIINKGFEVLINGAVIRDKKFNWDLSVNATFLKNNVTGMPSAIPTGYIQGPGTSDASVEIIQNGLPMDAFFTRKFIGMDKDGFALYQDDGNTFYYVGNPNPKTLAGITSTIRYNKLTFTANMYGAFGQDIFNNTRLNIINISGINTGSNIGLSAYREPVKESVANPVTPSSRFIVKGNYLKMANLTINYYLGNVAKTFKEANFYLTGQNLFIITQYPGFDPESNFDGSINNVPSLGIDFVQYPSARTLILGVSFSL